MNVYKVPHLLFPKKQKQKKQKQKHKHKHKTSYWEEILYL